MIVIQRELNDELQYEVIYDTINYSIYKIFSLLIYKLEVVFIDSAITFDYSLNIFQPDVRVY